MPVLETLGVALAVPGVIDVIVRGGEAVYDRVETFKSVDKAVNSFRQIALDIREGPLFFGLETLRGVSKDRMVPSVIKDQLDKSLTNLEQELKLSKEGLKSVHDDTLRGKLVYTLWRGKGSQHQLLKLSASLKTSCDSLKDLCLQLHSFRFGQSSYFWTSDTFKVRHETLDNESGERLPLSDLTVAHGNYAELGKRVEADFILEKKARENDVRYLCSVLNQNALAGRSGILPVLGYRQPPFNEPDGTKIFQLIVQLPQAGSRQSLARWIASSPQPNILDRLEICLILAKSLSSVHTLGLVHKSLRPRAILMLGDVTRQNTLPRLFLQDWTYIREVSGATTQMGEDSWHKALYQHPERQGKYAEAVYQPKHDIYSLGVNMLEILLWKPFVLSDPTLPSDEPFGICSLFEETGLRLGEQNGGLPERYKGGDALRLTSRPRAIKAVWCEVARCELTDQDLRNLVLGCLDECFVEVSDVADNIDKLVAARV